MSGKNILIILFLFSILSSVNGATEIILQDNFDDGTLDGWDVNSGTWTASNFDLNGAVLDTGSISHSVTMPSSSIYHISYTARTDLPNLYSEFFFFTDQNGLSDVNGYAVLLNTTTVFLEKRVNGVPTFLLSSSGISLSNTHTVDIIYTNGQFNVLIDNISIGLVTDTTFTHGTKVFFTTENNTGTYAHDNLLITRETDLVNVIFLRPKNEKTLNSIDGNWSVQLLNGPTSSFQNGNDASKTFLAIQNDQNFYRFIVDDGNSLLDNYYARNYVVFSDVNDSNTMTIQPYLIEINDAILVNLRVYDLPSNITLPNIRTTITSGINGSDTVMEDAVTDSTGISQVVLLPQKQYSLNITSPNQQTNYYSGTLTASSTSQSFYINYNDSNSTYNPKEIYISISPTTNTIDGTTQRFDFNVSANFTYDKVIVEAWDNNYIRTTTTSTSNPFNSFINLTLADFNSGIASVKIIISDGDMNSAMTKSYFITSTGNGGITNLSDLQNTFNPTNFLLTGVIAIVLFIGYLGVGKFGNFDQSVYIGGILLGIMTYLLFSEYFVYMIGSLLVGAVAWMWTRVNK